MPTRHGKMLWRKEALSCLGVEGDLMQILTDLIFKFIRLLLGTALLLSVLLICANAFGRYVLHAPIIWAEEVLGYVLVWIVHLGACSRRKWGNQNQEALDRSRGGFSTKFHLRVNAKGDPLTFDVTPGEAHEVKGYDALMELHDVDPDRLRGDRGYDSDEIRDELTDRCIEPVIPPRSNRTTPIEYDRETYKRRNLIERCVNRLKQFRRIATRYEKTARACLSMLCIASTMLWLKNVNST
jgi:transposase